MRSVLLLLRRLLFPFSWLYGAVTDLRNLLYDNGFYTVHSFDVRTIGVGNLTVGGTGKTPHIEYLIRLLKPEYAQATLSRGYGRKTTGFRIATEQDTAETLGDEPLQLFQKFGREVTVCVGEKRAEAIPLITEKNPGIILLDDAFQHRPVKPFVNLLLTDFHRPFFEDLPFPAGNLRERRHGARRADAVIITKCPGELSQAERDDWSRRISRYTRPGTPVFFSSIRYGEPVPVRPGLPFPKEREVTLVSGLARPELFERYAKSRYRVAGHLAFGDHHAYTSEDWQRMTAMGNVLLTTEKDVVKLRAFPQENASLFYLPIEVYFPEQGAFDTWLWSRLSVNKA